MHTVLRHQITNSCQELLSGQHSLLHDTLDAAEQFHSLIRIEVLGGDDDDRCLSASLELTIVHHELEPVHHRHHQIEQHQIGTILLCPIEGDGAVLGLIHGPPVVCEGALKERPYGVVVIHHQGVAATGRNCVLAR